MARSSRAKRLAIVSAAAARGGPAAGDPGFSGVFRGVDGNGFSARRSGDPTASCLRAGDIGFSEKPRGGGGGGGGGAEGIGFSAGRSGDPTASSLRAGDIGFSEKPRCGGDGGGGWGEATGLSARRSGDPADSSLHAGDIGFSDKPLGVAGEVIGFSAKRSRDPTAPSLESRAGDPSGLSAAAPRSVDLVVDPTASGRRQPPSRGGCGVGGGGVGGDVAFSGAAPRSGDRAGEPMDSELPPTPTTRSER